MIAACPQCAARYRVDESKVGARGARIRCAKCSGIFRVPAPETEPAASTHPADPGKVPPHSAGSGGGIPSALPGEDRDRRIVVAMAPTASAIGIGSTLEAWGLEVLGVSDGAQAMLAIARTSPRWVILDATLPGMNGRQICEFLKRNQSLREIKVLLVFEDDNHPPSASLFEYAPDANLKWKDVPGSLREVMEEFGLPLAAESDTGDAPAEAPPAAAADGLDGERARAERLARIVVSDIVLYQGELFDRASRQGSLVEDFHTDLDEGRQLLAERIDDRVCKERDFLVEELLRVAETRRQG